MYRANVQDAGVTQEDRMAMAEAAQKSEKIARRISASRIASSKAMLRFYERGPLPSHAGDEEIWRADNAAPTGRAEGQGLREVVAGAIAIADLGDHLAGLLPGTLATLALNAYDEEFRCPVERLPQPAVTFARCLAHVESLGTGMNPQSTAQVARRLMLALLNHERVRRPVTVVRSQPVEPAPAHDPGPEPPSPSAAASSEPEVALSMPAVDSPATRAGRQLRGYGKVTNALMWAAGTGETPVGTVLEVLRPNEREREDVQQSEARHQPVVVVWWEGRARLVPRASVTPATRDEWNVWLKENGS